MFFMSASELAQRTGTLDNWGASIAEQQWKPELDQFLGTSARQAFDRTLGARAWEAWWQIPAAEQEAERAGTLRRFESAEEYADSEYARPGIKYVEGMSNERARILAENYDQRREWERVIEGGYRNGGWQYAVLGFGAGMLGSLPDPINLIPFGGQAVAGGKLAGMTARQIMRQAGKQGLIEGAVGNLVSSSVAAWDLNRKGEDITAQDILLDTAFGAVAGPLFSTGGALLGRAGARAGVRASSLEFASLLPAGGEGQFRFVDLLEGMGRKEAEAYAQAHALLTNPDLRAGSDFLRKHMTDAERLEFSRALEFALLEVDAGRAVDVGPILRESQALGKAWDLVRREIDARTPAGKPDDILVLLEPQDADSMGVQRGPMVEVNGEMQATGGAVQNATGTKQGYGLTKVQIKHPDVTRADVMSIPRIMREYEPVGSAGKHSGRTWVIRRSDGRLLVIGEAVRAEDGQGLLATVHIDDQSKRPHSIRKRPSSPNGSRVNGFPPVSTDTNGGLVVTRKHTRSRQDNLIIVREGEEVNLTADSALRELGADSGPDGNGGANPRPLVLDSGQSRLDWRTEAREEFPPLPDEGTLEARQAEAVEPSPEELEVQQMRQQGELSAEQLAELEAVEVEAAKMNEMQEAALSVAECVIGVMQ